MNRYYSRFYFSQGSLVSYFVERHMKRFGDQKMFCVLSLMLSYKNTSQASASSVVKKPPPVVDRLG